MKRIINKKVKRNADAKIEYWVADSNRTIVKKTFSISEAQEYRKSKEKAKERWYIYTVEDGVILQEY